MRVKKILAGFLSAAMIFSMIPTTAFATEPDDSGNTTGTGTPVAEEHEHDFETNEPVLSEDGTKLIYTCAVEGCEETRKEDYVADTPSVTNTDDLDTNEDIEPQNVDNGADYVAQIGEDNNFFTLQEAITTAPENTEITITLLTNTSEDISIPKDKNIILDLNGQTLTNVSSHTITNNGTLTITDNSAGGPGTVDSITHAMAALYNFGTLTIKKGIFTRSKEEPYTKNTDGKNSWYTVVNVGTITEISGGTFRTGDGTAATLGNLSSLIRNGDGTNPGTIQWISGGSFTSAANVIKNEPGSTINSITGGAFTMDNTVNLFWGGNHILQNEGTIDSITGGTFTAVGSGQDLRDGTTYKRYGIFSSGTITELGGNTVLEMTGDNNYGLAVTGTVTVTGGTYSVSDNEDTAENAQSHLIRTGSSAVLKISGGTFSEPVSVKYCADGYIPITSDSEGTYTVDNGEGNYAAAIANEDGTYRTFESIDKALLAIKDSDATIVLLKNSEENVTNLLYGNNVILDLNGHTLTGQVTLRKGTLTLRNGIVSNPDGQAVAVCGGSTDQANYSVLNVESTATVAGSWGICLFGYNAGNFGYGAVINVEGTVEGVIFVHGILGNTEESAAAMMEAKNPSVINVKSGAKIINQADGQGIAMNGYAVVNVEDGASITGREAIGVKRGILNITGGTFTATGEKKDPAEANNNGTEETGAAISVTSTYNYAGIIDVNISGGTFISQHNSALYVGHSAKNNTANAYVKGVSVEITDGTFTGGTDQKAVYIADAIDEDDENYTKQVVSGGIFSSAVPEDYCAKGYEPVNDPDENGEYTVKVDSDTAVAMIDGVDTKYFLTLQDAIDEAGSADTIKLIADTSEDITISKGQTVTLDLNGKTLTNASSHTITNNGTLTITDTSTGAVGTVDNVTHAKAAIFNENGATCTILAGQFTRSKESGQNGEDNGGNSFYTINNYGTMTIGAEEEDAANNITVTANGHYSSLVHNGWQNSKDAVDKTATMNIYGGTFTGGINTIKNDESGALTISGGKFVNVTQYALMNWNKAEISGGTFESDTMSAIFNGADADTSKGELSITGGTFTAPSEYPVVYNDTETGAAAKITGGTYSSQYYTNDNSALNYTTEVLDNETNFKVVECNAQNSVASITENEATTYYATLQNAVKAAMANETTQTVKLLKNVELGSSVVVSGKVILDLNDCSITRKAGNTTNYLIGVTASGELTVSDSGTTGQIISDNYTITDEDGSTTTYAGYGILTNGNAVIQNGTVSGYYGVFVSGSDASAIVSGESKVIGTYAAIGQNSGSVIVKDNAEVATTEGYYGILSQSSAGKSSLKIQGGTISANNENSEYAVIGVSVVNSGSYDAELTISDGKIQGNTNGIRLRGTSEEKAVTSTITGGEISSTGTSGSCSAIQIMGNSAGLTDGEDTRNAYSASVTVSNATVSGVSGITLWGKGAELTVQDKASITGTTAFGISGNGTHNNNENDSGTNIKITGGTIQSQSATGIYHPQDGTLDISGGTISGAASGIEMRAGKLTVSGNADIKSEANEFKVNPNGGGTTTVGAGIAIVEHTTNLGVNVEITGGTISGQKALYQADLQNANPDNVKISITNGTFTSSDSSENAEAIHSENCTGFVSGGNFSSVVLEKYCASGYIPTTDAVDGMYTVTEAVYIASVTGSDNNVTKYVSLQDAINESESDSIITLLADVELKSGELGSNNASLWIKGKSLTLDLNGHSITRASGNEDRYLMGVNASGSLTIRDTSENQSGEIGGSYFNTDFVAFYGIYVAGTIELQSGTVSGFFGVATSSGCIRVTGGTIRTANGGFGINVSGTGQANITDGLVYGILQQGGSVTIGDDAEVQSYSSTNFKSSIKSDGGILTITGGTITGGTTDNQTGEAITASDTMVSVSGGNFSSRIPSEYCANGYVPTIEPDSMGLYSVVLGPKFYTRTLTLDGTIGVNFYVDMSNVTDSLTDYKMVYSVYNDKEELVKKLNVPLSESEVNTFNEKKYYRFTCPVASKQMTDTIHAQLFKNDVSVSKEYTYSVKTYCKNMISKYGENSSLTALLKAMLNYGGYAQTQFQYNMDTLANAGLYDDDSDPVENAVDLSEYVGTKSESFPTGISGITNTLFLDSETTIRFYLKIDDSYSIDSYTCTLDGTKVIPMVYTGSDAGEKGNYYVEVTNIRAQNLDAMHTLTVQYEEEEVYTLTYGALTYAYNQLNNNSADESLKNLVKAMYLYNQAAENYIANANN